MKKISERIYDLLLNKIKQKDRILRNEPMKNHTTFQIGGPADFFIFVKEEQELKEIILLAKKEGIPIYIIGNGSNLLVKDGGVRGIVVKPDFRKIKLINQGEDWYIVAGAALDIKQVSRLALENSLTGLEFACGIPGSVGGAVRMNAGAYNGEMKNVVVSTMCMDEKGEIKEIEQEKQQLKYRHSIFYDNSYIILQTKLRLKKGNKQEIESKMKEFTQLREKFQPLEMPSAGSTFKRGDGFLTSLLIEQAGLKGYQIGGAAISEKHGGFVINKDNATAKDVLELTSQVKNKIKEIYNKDILLEIEVIGED